MSTDPVEDVTTVSETAEMYGVTTGALRQAIIEKRLFSHRSGNVHIIRVVDVLAYFKRQPNQWPERLKKWEMPEL